jgi:hypothetical protein
MLTMILFRRAVAFRWSGWRRARPPTIETFYLAQDGKLAQPLKGSLTRYGVTDA